MSELTRRLNKLSKQWQFSMNLNNGGCCWYTYEIAKLCERYKIPFKIYIADDDGHISNAELEYIKSFQSDYILHDGFNHVWIALKPNLRYVQVNGANDYWNIRIVSDITSAEILNIYTNLDWNRTFKTSNKAKIKKQLALTFKQFAL